MIDNLEALIDEDSSLHTFTNVLYLDFFSRQDIYDVKQMILNTIIKAFHLFQNK